VPACFGDVPRDVAAGLGLQEKVVIGCALKAIFSQYRWLVSESGKEHANCSARGDFIGGSGVLAIISFALPLPGHSFKSVEIAFGGSASADWREGAEQASRCKDPNQLRFPAHGRPCVRFGASYLDQDCALVNEEKNETVTGQQAVLKKLKEDFKTDTNDGKTIAILPLYPLELRNFSRVLRFQNSKHS